MVELEGRNRRRQKTNEGRADFVRMFKKSVGKHALSSNLLLATLFDCTIRGVLEKGGIKKEWHN
jgi:hypothetical protein